MAKAKRKAFKLRLPKKWRPAIALAGIVVIGAATTLTVMKLRELRPAAPPMVVRATLPLPPAPAPQAPQVARIEPPQIQPPHLEPPPVAAPTPAPGAAPAWLRYAAQAPAFDGRPLVAIVIDDLGLDRKRSARAASLPGPLTLAWLPYAGEVSKQAAAARAAGHEILLHAPMQPEGRENPGPNALTVDLSVAEIERRLNSYLALLPEAAGFNNHMGSRFTADARAMAPVVAEAKARGLLFLDSRTSGRSVAGDLARDAGVPTAWRDVFLDNEQNGDYVRARLAEVEAAARRHGAAIAIGHPHEATLEALEPWLRGLAARGFTLAPVSAVIRYRQERPVAGLHG